MTYLDRQKFSNHNPNVKYLLISENLNWKLKTAIK